MSWTHREYPYGPGKVIPGKAVCEACGGLPINHIKGDCSTMRTFESGATRDNDDSKLDFEGFFSTYALEAYAEYLNKHRKQADGQLRDSDNWQSGMPLQVYMKSAWRHFFDMWKIHRGRFPVDRKTGHAITMKDAA